jgi:hypothetical protein
MQVFVIKCVSCICHLLIEEYFFPYVAFKIELLPLWLCLKVFHVLGCTKSGTFVTQIVSDRSAVNTTTSPEMLNQIASERLRSWRRCSAADGLICRDGPHETDAFTGLHTHT